VYFINWNPKESYGKYIAKHNIKLKGIG